jgi:hypothetical protein
MKNDHRKVRRHEGFVGRPGRGATPVQRQHLLDQRDHAGVAGDIESAAKCGCLGSHHVVY